MKSNFIKHYRLCRFAMIFNPISPHLGSNARRNPLIFRSVFGPIPLRYTEDYEAGLIGQKKLSLGEGILIQFPSVRFWSAHSIGVPYPIEVICLVPGNIVVDIINLPEHSTAKRSRLPCDRFLELNKGMVNKLGINIGDRLDIEYA